MGHSGVELAKVLGAELLGVLVPPLCHGCGIETRLAVDLLCRLCDSGLERLPESCCPACAQPRAMCAREAKPCPADGAPWNACVAACRHDGVARELVAALKRSGSRRLADLMAAEIAGRLGDIRLASAAVVPVAPHRVRVRQSGVDHALALAAALARRTGRPLARPLRRVGAPVRQAGSSRVERLEPGRVNFAVVGRSPRRVLLVDDVHTTGATLRSAAAELIAGGCEQVICATFARALGGPLRLQPGGGW